MSERIKVLTDLRNQALADARKVVDDAESAGRKTLEGDEETRYSKFLEDWDKYNAAVKREQELADRESAAIEDREEFVPVAQPKADPEPSFEERLLAAVKDGSKSYSLEMPHGYRMPTGSDETGIEVRTDYPHTTGDASTTYSSYAVQAGIVQPTIEELRYAYSAVLQAGVNAITTDGINSMYIPKVLTAPTINAAGAAASFENTAPTNSSYPVLGRTTLDGYRLDAFAVITEEDIASASVDMMGFLNRELASALAAKVAYMLVIGSGSNAPNGLQLAATTGATAASTTTFTGDEVISTYQSISAQYRPGLRCVVSQSAETLLAQLKDDNGNYIWRSGLVAGNPDAILGVPMFVDPQGQALTAGLKPLVFYNPSAFHVRWAMGGRVMYDVSTEAQFTQFNRVIRIAQWMDCDAGNAAAVHSLTLHS